MNQPLESYKLFPAVAWTLIIAFSAFTVSLTYNLKIEAESLATVSDTSTLPQ